MSDHDNPPEINEPAPPHVPVLLAEVLELLGPQPGEIAVDATAGLGGHAVEIASRISPTTGPAGRLILIDRDSSNLPIARSRLPADCPTDLVHANFERIEQVLQSLQVSQVDIVLADLGFLLHNSIKRSADSASAEMGRWICG